MVVWKPFSSIYLTATTTQHLTWQRGIVTSIVATGLSHFLTRFTLGKVTEKLVVCPMPNLPNCPETAVLAEFRDYLPSTLDIKQTISTLFHVSSKNSMAVLLLIKHSQVSETFYRSSAHS